MEHHALIIEEAEKEVCFQTIALSINTGVSRLSPPLEPNPGLHTNW